MTTTCHPCGATWTAAGAAHCAKCHTTFPDTRTFDAHRGNCTTPPTQPTKDAA